jgi:uncharacterized protein (DUF2141 family)
MVSQVIMLLLSTSALCAQTFTLTVNVKGFRAATGSMEAALFDKADAFPKNPEKAIARERTRVKDGGASIVFQNVKPGTYAVAVYHDVNDNGKMDANFLGVPKEPTGASNGAKGKMGPPSFTDAQFILNADREITISLQ